MFSYLLSITEQYSKFLVLIIFFYVVFSRVIDWLILLTFVGFLLLRNVTFHSFPMHLKALSFEYFKIYVGLLHANFVCHNLLRKFIVFKLVGDYTDTETAASVAQYNVKDIAQ